MTRWFTAVAVLALLTGTASASQPPINLPDPTHTCAQLVTGAHVVNYPIQADTLGQVFAEAIRLNGPATFSAGKKITVEQLIRSFSDTMGCFVSPKKIGAGGASPTPLASPQ